MNDVWCSKCADPATHEVELTTGETKAYCNVHIRLVAISTPGEAWASALADAQARMAEAPEYRPTGETWCASCRAGTCGAHSAYREDDPREQGEY